MKTFRNALRRSRTRPQNNICSAVCFGITLLELLSCNAVSAEGLRGLVTSKPCPYTCATEGIPRIDCRDWNHGNVCFIEDFRYPQDNPSGGAAIGSRNPGGMGDPPSSNPQQYDRRWGNQGGQGSNWGNQGNQGNWSNSGSGQYPPRVGNGGNNYSLHPQGANTIGASNHYDGAGTGVGECQSLRVGEVSKPRVYISRVTPVGGGYSQRVRVQGTIEGVCLSDAGIFEGGRKRETISVRAQRRMQRYDFDVQGNSNGGSEIRVYNTAGEGDYAEVRPVALPNNSGFGGFTGGFGLGG